MGEVRTVLDHNQGTLRHLTLGAYLQRNHSWDHAFQSATIRNLTHLELVDTRISHVVLARIAHAHRLEGLTLHGTLEEPCSAGVVFGSDHVIDGVHTFLPHLEALDTEYFGQAALSRYDDVPAARLRELTVRTSSVHLQGFQQLWTWIRRLTPRPSLEAFTLNAFSTRLFCTRRDTLNTF